MTEPSTLAPALLLSMPQLQDPNFDRTVVLLCQHDTDGAFGLVLNRPVTTTARIVSRTPMGETGVEQELDVWIGGPVEPERSWILMPEAAPDDNSVEVCEGVFLSTSPSVLQQIVERSADPRMRLIAGYAGWGPGQLDAELASSAWLSVDVQLDLVFETPAERMWETAIRRLGADPGSLQMGQGVH